ncbi:RNA polymerase sigma factor [Rhodoferax sp. UBA5149]|uniref:RNA polymerase sigma factor n=1 Tax=Rhodoferax sp. UBA5149 TaxID=1947379 RepID=UPI0025DA3C22|nr:RNA polymerase sigma factor [Rhodoferax sp. UBA5149]
MNTQPIVNQIPALRRYARALTGDTWAADDLVQDTLERACSKWRLWAVGSDLRAWLFTLMHNLFANQVRRATRQAQGSTVDIDDVAHELAAPDANLGNAMDLQRCLLLLPQDQRVVLLLVSVEDMSYREVAQITGIPVGTVMSRLSRARSRLQALLDAPARSAEAAPASDAQAVSVPPPSHVIPLHRLK